MTVICDECGSKMPTAKILELHKIKRHGGEKKGETTVIKPAADLPPVASTPLVSPETPPTTPVVEGMVELVSADNRVLEVSVGKTAWVGKTIQVPADMETEVRRILIDGGFFLKN